MKRNIIALFFICINITIYAQHNDNILYPIEIMPVFPGGEVAMYEHIMKHMSYPQDAIDKNIEGKVITRFLVSETGKIDSILVIKGIHPQCDSVAISIISTMPDWVSGRIQKKMTPTHFTLPIVFKLSQPQKTGEENDNRSTHKPTK